MPIGTRSEWTTPPDDGATTIAGVLVYEERYLSATGKPPASPPAFALVGALHRAVDAAERECAVRAELRAIGADWLEFGKVLVQDAHGVHGEQDEQMQQQPVSLLRSYAPPDWTEAYCRLRYWEHDPRLQRAGVGGAPCGWTVAEERQRVEVAHPARRMFDTLAACGVGSGITIVLGTSGSGHRIAMHFLSSQADLQWADRSALAGALLLGVSLNEFVSRHALPVTVNPLLAGMSALQARIADCVQRGFSDKEVARSLELSRHTVDYHLRALRHRFNARNRVQLAQAIGGLAAVSRSG